MKWLGVLMLSPVAGLLAYGVYKDKALRTAVVAIFCVGAIAAWTICAIFLIAHGRLR